MQAEHYYRLKEIAQLQNPAPKLEEFLKEVKPERKRTEQQNSALLLDMRMIAEKLNDAGYDMREVLKEDVEIPWSTTSVKEHIWKPIMKTMYGKESTKELDKTSGEIEMIHDTIMRHLGKYIEPHEFPHEEKESKLNAPNIDYPDTYREPKI